MGLVNTVVPLADLEKRPCAGVVNAAEQPDGLALPESGAERRLRRPAGLQELAGNATMLFYMTEEGRKDATPSTRNVSRTSANLNGIHNARFAGLPLADTDGRGRGAARAAVKTRDGLFIRLQEGNAKAGAKFLPAGIQCRDAGRGANGAVSVGTGLARRRRAAASAALRRVWHQLRAGGAAADYRRLRIIARRRSAPAIRMSYSPDWRRCPARRSLRSKLASEAVRDGMVVNLLLEAIPDLQLRLDANRAGRRSKRNSSPTLIRRTASALLFLKNLAKRGRILGPLAARRGSLSHGMKACARRISALSPSRGACGGDQTDANRQLQKVQQQVAAAHALGLSVVISSSIESSRLTQLARVAAADAADYSAGYAVADGRPAGTAVARKCAAGAQH